MKIPRAILLLLVAYLLGAGRGDAASGGEWLDRLDEALTVNAFDGNVRARFSGTLDLEGYCMQQPPPGLIDTDRNFLFNPRLTLFFDAQLGSAVYFFAQSRVDRGFDPSDGNARMRLDEYALRITPWMDARFNLQVGKFATVAGNWAQRHGSWENPFITAPLPYENLTGIWDASAVDSPYTLLQWAHAYPSETAADIYSDKKMRVPIIWGPSYATGIAVSGALGQVEYAAEVKNSSLSSRPDSWDIGETGFSHPTYTGRLGYRPNPMWNFGFSASAGPYLLPSAAPTLPAGRGIGDYDELLLGQDISFAWHHLQIWAEFYEVRFQVPNVGNADTFAYYVEAKYKITPQLFGALRWNQQLFGDIRDDDGELTPWGRDAWRVDAALGYRLSEHAQVKFQYSILQQDLSMQTYNHMLAAQFTLRF